MDQTYNSNVLLQTSGLTGHQIAAVLITAALAATPVPAIAHEPTEHHAASSSTAQDASQPLAKRLAHLPPLADLPLGVERISPHVPGMGEHWADPRDLPLGPVYCVMEGRVTCMEFMIAQQDLRDGKSFERLRPWHRIATPQPPVDHVNFDFVPKGHPGFEVPHYDVHLYFVPAALLEQDKKARQKAH